MSFLKTLFKTRYRIVTDRFNGYEVQHRPWWCPFYYMPYTNTFHSVERAEQAAEAMNKRVVKYLT